MWKFVFLLFLFVGIDVSFPVWHFLQLVGHLLVWCYGESSGFVSGIDGVHDHYSPFSNHCSPLSNHHSPLSNTLEVDEHYVHLCCIAITYSKRLDNGRPTSIPSMVMLGSHFIIEKHEFQ